MRRAEVVKPTGIHGIGPRLRGDDNGDCGYGWVMSCISRP